MAIYSLSHSAVGRTTHAAGTAGAHAGYITRDSAAREIVGEHMPTERNAARDWLNQQEASDRKNARVIDKVMLALPRELDAAARVEVVRAFAAEVGGGRIAWLAGIHDRGRDAGNPHAHILFRDRDIETGKRVAGFTEKGSTERLRETWERVANQALERAGFEERIDRRSLEAQGNDRQPGIHVGPKALAMEERGVRPRSELEILDNGRVIEWPRIDRGRTRIEYLAEIEAANENQRREREREKGGKGRGDPVPVLTAERSAEEDRPRRQDERGREQREEEIAPAVQVQTRADQARAPELGPEPVKMPVPEAEVIAAREAREAAAREAARARSWVAQRSGLEELDARQRASAERSFAAWREKAPQLAARSGFDLAAYVAFVQRKEAERDQPRPAPVSEPVKEPERAEPPRQPTLDAPEPVAVPSMPEPERAQASPEVTRAEAEPQVSRLRQALDRARERLNGLGQRLDDAIQAFRRRYFEREQRAEPEAHKPSPENAGPSMQLRRSLDAYRRNWGPDRNGPQR